MFVIRDAQLKVFGEAARRSAIELVRDHVRKNLDELVGHFTDSELDALLSRIAAEAEQRGLIGMRSLMLFTNLSLVYGVGFVERPELSWMKTILQDKKSGQPAEQLRKLYLKAMEPPAP